MDCSTSLGMPQRVTDKGAPFWEIGGLFWPTKPAALEGRAGMGLIFTIKHEGIKIAAQQLQQRLCQEDGEGTARASPVVPRAGQHRRSSGTMPGAAGQTCAFLCFFQPWGRADAALNPPWLLPLPRHLPGAAAAGTIQLQSDLRICPDSYSSSSRCSL